ncbi:uncharacterized protein N7511_004351 [Penicillium nucicola]|uniref:uncharacterized protein n=1 Tax=Penicillium nucicola TaxID=1850975 RepID=UPI0025457E9A|nr:uncharacterized protein N7511_004351 [Penicillium nucicola]KAJ5766735.1 hypothetical protein N7511_004351 [Penicillium nucicola]
MRIEAPLDCDLCTQGSNDCYALNHIQSEIQSVEHGLHDAILLAIPLGKSQFDLTVEWTTASRIRDHFTDISHLRLLSSDPLFAAEIGRSSSETAFAALTQIRRQYNLAASSIYKSNDPRRIRWFETETKHIEGLLQVYQQQCVDLAGMSFRIE